MCCSELEVLKSVEIRVNGQEPTRIWLDDIFHIHSVVVEGSFVAIKNVMQVIL
jgi:hypothetical protein